eukprot:2102521-Amphidinium_carterae.1
MAIEKVSDANPNICCSLRNSLSFSPKRMHYCRLSKLSVSASTSVTSAAASTSVAFAAVSFMPT